MNTQLPHPWLCTQAAYLGRLDRVDEYAAYWDEEGFLASDPQYTIITTDFYRSAPGKYILPGGRPNPNGILAHYRFSLGQGIGKDAGRYFLLAAMFYDNGETLKEGPIGEYAGTGHGICLAYRGKGAGRAFFKELMKRGIWTPEALGYSPGGRATAISAHRSLIQDALNTGWPIHPDILADYPTLRANAPTTQSPPHSTR